MTEPAPRAGKLTGRVALITGTDSGIGQGTAVEFAKEGARLAVHYLTDAEGADRTRRRVEEFGGRAITVQADVGDEHDVEAMFDRAVAEFGTVHVLVNNAAAGAAGKNVADLDTATWDRAIRTNVYGTFF